MKYRCIDTVPKSCIVTSLHTSDVTIHDTAVYHATLGHGTIKDPLNSCHVMAHRGVSHHEHSQYGDIVSWQNLCVEHTC